MRFKNTPEWLWMILIISVITLIGVIAYKINARVKNTNEKKIAEKENGKKEKKMLKSIFINE